VTYRFTRLWARVLVITGSIVIVLGVLAAVAVGIAGPDLTRYASDLDPRVTRVVAVVLGATAAIVVGAPLIVAGQLLDAFLDQRDILARIHRRLRKKRAGASVDDRSRLFPPRVARR